MDPEEQESVREEIIAFPPEWINSLDDMQNWLRLRNVLLEALRLYPPAPHIIRDAEPWGPCPAEEPVSHGKPSMALR